jgi:hypothetical protein
VHLCSEMFHSHCSSGGANLVDPLQSLPDAVLSPAIPATPDEDAHPPCPGSVVPRGPAEAIANDFPSLLDASFPQPQPLPLPSAQTPFRDDQPQFDLNFAGVLPPTNVSLPTPTIVKTAHNLRLPSFDVLGIAAPHPDRFPLTPSHSFSSTALGAGPLSKPDDPLHALSPPLDHRQQADTATHPFDTSPKAARAQVDRTVVPTFTPPSEPGTFNWGVFMSVRPAGPGSPPSSDPGRSPSLNLTASATAPGQAPIIVPTSAELSDAVTMAVWVEEAKNIISKHKDCVVK